MSDEATPADREEAFEAWWSVTPIVEGEKFSAFLGFLAGYDASAARVAELVADLERRAADCAKLAETYAAADAGSDSLRCSGKSKAYAHAAELVRAYTPGEGGDHVR